MSPDEARDLFLAIDPDKPETVNAVLDHMRTSLEKSVCPMCFGATRKTLVRDILVWNCLSCEVNLPPLPSGNVTLISPHLRASIANILRLAWELSHA